MKACFCSYCLRLTYITNFITNNANVLVNVNLNIAWKEKVIIWRCFKSFSTQIFKMYFLTFVMGKNVKCIVIVISVSFRFMSYVTSTEKKWSKFTPNVPLLRLIHICLFSTRNGSAKPRFREIGVFTREVWRAKPVTYWLTRILPNLAIFTGNIKLFSSKRYEARTVPRQSNFIITTS